MNKTYTLDDLILLSYNETGNEKTGEIKEALNKDEELLDEYHFILNIRDILDDLYQEPAESTISTILNYSKALNVFKLKPAVNTGFFIVN